MTTNRGTQNVPISTLGKLSFGNSSFIATIPVRISTRHVFLHVDNLGHLCGHQLVSVWLVSILVVP